MSKIATGVRFTDRARHRGYGYLAIFSDGDVRKHTTDFPKSHCVRVTIARYQRWQQAFRIRPDRPVVDGMQQVDFGGHSIYEWFKTEQEAVREVQKAAGMTLANNMGERYYRDPNIHPLNADTAKLPYYSDIEVVEPRVVWAVPNTIETLAALNDPRIRVSTPAMVADALAQLAATYVSDFTPQEVGG